MYSSYSVAAAVCSCVFPAVATLSVALRFRARFKQKLKLGLDDWAIALALIFASAYCCIVLHGSFRASIGQDLTTITRAQFSEYQKHLFAGVISAHLSYGFAKMSVLHFYKRIFVTQKFRQAANIVLVVVILFMIAATATQVFSAWPISKQWTLGESWDINYGAFITSFAAIDLVLDIVILCLPVPVIRGLHVNTRKKFLLIGIFWMGLFCVVATAVRLYFGYKFSLTGGDRPVSDDEFSYVSVYNIIWAEIESCCSVLAACLPTYGPLVRTLAFPRAISNTLQSLMDSVRGRKSADRSKGSFKQNVWFPLSEDRRNFATAKKTSESDMELVESGEIRVEHSFLTNVEAARVRA